MANSEAEGSNNHSSQQEDSLVLQDREFQPDELSTVEGSVLDSVGAGTGSPASPHYTAGRRERTLRQRKHVNYTEPADNPLKDNIEIKRQFRQGENHATTAPIPVKRGRGRPPKYTQAQQQHSNALQSIRSSSRNPSSIINSRFQPVRYSKRSLQARDDDEDHENDAYESLRTKVRRLSQSNDAKLNSSSRYNMRTRSKEVDHAEDNRDDEGDDEGDDEDDDDDLGPTKHTMRTQSRMQNSFLDTGSPSVDEERAPNAQYSLRTRKNVSYSENHLRAGFEARASPSPKSYSPSLRSNRVSRWRISNEENGGHRNLPSEKAYHLRKRAHPPNFYAVPPPPVIPPKPTSNVRPHRSHRTSSLFRHIGSGSSDEESIRRNVKQLRGGESGSRILPLNLLELKGSRDSSLLGPAILTDQNSISDKLEGQSFDFESIGGLDHHIKSLKEMILLPLLYPELYANFQITPPRGALLYGPPGTGKTLMARALANSCSTQTQKVAFFMRKGADCLSKWVGEAERELKLLFEEAKKWQPSIIFFDEIDGK
jgi:ATPase family associated with various cellular activities (AAA)